MTALIVKILSDSVIVAQDTLGVTKNNDGSRDIAHYYKTSYLPEINMLVGGRGINKILQNSKKYLHEYIEHNGISDIFDKLKIIGKKLNTEFTNYTGNDEVLKEYYSTSIYSIHVNDDNKPIIWKISSKENFTPKEHTYDIVAPAITDNELLLECFNKNEEDSIYEIMWKVMNKQAEGYRDSIGGNCIFHTIINGCCVISSRPLETNKENG